VARNNTVVFEHRGIEPIELRIINVGLDDAFFEIVEANRARHAAKICEGFLVQFAPDLRRRFPTVLRNA
jgi:hypothetical protein